MFTQGIFTLSIFMTFVLGAFSSQAFGIDIEIYSQTTYLHKFKNLITQNKMLLHHKSLNLNFYGGVYIDSDDKTNSKVAYTDAQVSPLAGVQSDIFGGKFLFNRVFIEGRYVHRIKSFPDQRPKETYEARAGIFGYGLGPLGDYLFIENYYALFFSRLYQERILFQGWTRQGFSFYFTDVFNEFFYDSFDQTRGRDGSFDLRPGIRFNYRLPKGTIQLIHQYIHHLTNLDFAGRNEHRSSLVLGLYF